MIPELKEWHDARKALFDASSKVDANAAKPYWERLAKAEHDLMDYARYYLAVAGTAAQKTL